jgi:hypothetical protein
MSVMKAYSSYKFKTVIPNIKSCSSNKEIHTELLNINGHPFSLVVIPGDGTQLNSMKSHLKYHGNKTVTFKLTMTIMTRRFLQPGVIIPGCIAKLSNRLQSLSKEKSVSEHT